MLEVVRAIARDRYQDLLDKGFDVSDHEASEGIDPIIRVNAARDILAAVPGIWTRSRTEERLASNTGCRPVQPSLPIVAISMTLPICVTRDYRDETTTGKVHLVQRAVGVH
jgi:hypothetical protein